MSATSYAFVGFTCSTVMYELEFPARLGCKIMRASDWLERVTRVRRSFQKVEAGYFPAFAKAEKAEKSRPLRIKIFWCSHVTRSSPSNALARLEVPAPNSGSRSSHLGASSQSKTADVSRTRAVTLRRRRCIGAVKAFPAIKMCGQTTDN